MDIQQEFEKLDIPKSFGVGLIIAALYWVLIFDDGSGFDAQIMQKNQEIITGRAKIKSIVETIENQKKFELELKELNQNIKDFQVYFEQDIDQNKLQTKVSELAEQSKVALNKLTKAADKANEFEKYKETAVYFEIEGDFDKIMEFISRITQMNSAIDFSKMEFKAIVGGDIPIVSFKTTLVVYSSWPTVSPTGGLGG